MGGARADTFGANHIADFITFQNDALQLTLGRRNELHIQMGGKFRQQFFVGQVHAMVVRSERQQAI
ncbi:hypothetical protein PS947_06012 [Pseudomonas fluorescens]|nr:hypothetical protein PS947_06012 [Pseudomonas fluorescens]